MDKKEKKSRKLNTLLSDRAVEYILTRDLEDLGHLDEEQIAQRLRVDLPSLLNTFESHQKITLRRFIIREKIHRALFILDKTPVVSIENLSRQLGFPQTRDFISEFTGYFHVAPDRYRELRAESL